MTALQPIVALYDTLLQPVFAQNPLLDFFGLHPERLTLLDWLATVRVCVAMRQIRTAEHAKTKTANVANLSFTHSALTTLTVIFGGELLTAPFLLQPPSFLTTPSTAAIVTAAQYTIDSIPASWIPTPSLQTELPLSLLDAFSRSYLLCTAIPPAVLGNALPQIRDSVWALAVTSYLMANFGITLTGMFSLFSPSGVQVKTPPELEPYGWATADLWVAPLISVAFALLTQGGVYAGIRASIGQVLGVGVQVEEKAVGLLETEEARALAALFLAMLFSGRAIKNFYVSSK